jgi:HEAT repeat protein/DNA polymerase III delta prime subunit
VSQTESGRLFSRRKHATVRARYLDYLQRDVQQRLAASIHAARFLDIGVNENLNATVPWHYKALEGEQHFSNFDLAFEHFQGRVLLLGPPGSGKTTTLLNLALKLIDEAQQNQAVDIPLLFNLSKFGSVSPKRVSEQLKWVRRRRDPTEPNPARVFEQWLVQMLVEMPVEGLNRQVAQQWVSSGNIAPLLDGLDEVNDTHLLKLAEILNQTYFREHPDQAVVVCSRVIEYQPLQENKEARLRLNGAVILQPPTPQQIDEYLEAAQALALRDALRGDNALYEMAQTPLTLSMMTLAYGGEAPTDIPHDLPFLERRRLLLDTYVERMVQRTARREKGVPFDLNSDNDIPPNYPLRQVNHYLGWLAIKLSERSRTLFPLAHFYSFLSRDYPDGDTSAIALKYGVAMFGSWLIALVTNAALLLPHGWSVTWALGVLPLLAPLAVLMQALEEVSLNTDIGDFIVEFVRESIPSLCALFSLWLITRSVDVLLGHRINSVVTMTMLLAVGTSVLLLLRPAFYWGRRDYVRSFHRPALLFLGLFSLITAISFFPSRSGQFASYVFATACTVMTFVQLRRSEQLPETKSWPFAFVFVACWGGLLLLAKGVEKVNLDLLVGLSIAMPIWFGMLITTYKWKGITITFAVVAVVVNWLAGVATAILAAVVMLLIHLAIGPLGFSSLLDRLVLDPILKLILVVRNSICFRYKQFLKYATNTMLLKEVGIEYEFVHRLLRDHFALRELLPQLYGSEGEQRLKIIQGLSKQGDSSFDALVSLVTNSDQRVRSAAIEGLGQIAIPKVFPIMQDRIENDPDEKVRVSVVQSVRKFGGEQEQIYDRAIQDSSPQVRLAAVVASFDDNRRHLGLQDDSDLVFRQTLIEISRRSSLYLSRATLSRALLERLIEAISDADGKVSAGAAIAIKSFYSSSVGENDIETRLTLDPAVAALINRSSDKDPAVRKAMISALSEIVDKGVHAGQHEPIKTALLKALHDRNSGVRHVAIPGLGKLKDPEIPRSLRKALKKRGVEQRRLILAQLGFARDRNSIPALIKYFAKSPYRYEAAHAMANLGLLSRFDGYSVVPDLLNLLDDPRRQAAAIMALTELQVKSVIPKLRKLLVQPLSQSIIYRSVFRQPDVRPFAAMALGKLGDVDSVPTLLGFSSSFPTKLLFSQACALGFLLSPDRLEHEVANSLATLPVWEQKALHRKLSNPKFGKQDDSQPLSVQLSKVLLRSRWIIREAVWNDDEDGRFFTY